MAVVIVVRVLYWHVSPDKCRRIALAESVFQRLEIIESGNKKSRPGIYQDRILFV